VSTLLDAEGNVTQTWVKTAQDLSDPATILTLFNDALLERPVIPAPAASPQKRAHNKDLLAVYPMGDPHIGMLSWHEETGTDFDLKIAETQLLQAVDHLVTAAPAAENALVINLGDFFHSDNPQHMTARSGNVLDVDSRWSKILRIGIRIMGRIVDRALWKHTHVTVIIEIGNHDDQSAVMLALCMAERYRNDPRVTVDTSPATFHWYEFGSVLIGTTHGQACKPEKLGAIMAADKPAEWGRTKHRYWYVGHVHTQQAWELPGCLVRTFRTLAPRDAWHASSHYRSGRSMVCDVLHRTHGRIYGHEIGVGQIEEQT
jgi:hypothetical protein